MRLRGLRLFLSGGDERNEGFWLSELALCKSPARAPGVALNRLRQKEAAGGAEQAIGEWPGRGKWILEKKRRRRRPCCNKTGGSLKVSTRASDWRKEKRVLALRNDAVDCARTGRIKNRSAKVGEIGELFGRQNGAKMKKDEKGKRNRDPGNGDAK